MPKGLLEAARQILATYPSKQEITESEWLADIVNWAENTKARLDALRINGTPWRFTKRMAGGAQSLTPEELETATKLILKCTDLSQLQRLRQTLYTQAQPLIMQLRKRFR